MPLTARFALPVVVVIAVFGLIAPVFAADTILWTKTGGWFTSLSSLEKECRTQGGIPDDFCYNASTNDYKPWTVQSCPSGYKPAVRCRASSAKTTTTAPATTPTQPQSAASAPAAQTPAPASTDAGSPAPSTDAGAGAGATDAGAAAGTDDGSKTLKNPLKFDSLPELMDGILQAVVELGAILLIFMLVWVGFLFVAAQGNPEKISSARTALIWVLIGGLILLGAEAISKVIEATVNSLTV